MKGHKISLTAFTSPQWGAHSEVECFSWSLIHTLLQLPGSVWVMWNWTARRVNCPDWSSPSHSASLPPTFSISVSLCSFLLSLSLSLWLYLCPFILPPSFFSFHLFTLKIHSPPPFKPIYLSPSLCHLFAFLCLHFPFFLFASPLFAPHRVPGYGS